MRVYKESWREREVEAEQNCWPVDCVKLQYVLPYHLQHEQVVLVCQWHNATPVQMVAKIRVVLGSQRQSDN